MALSGRRHAGIRLFLKGTSPLHGFVVDGRLSELDRAARWAYQNGKVVGKYPPDLHDELLSFVQRLADQVKDYESRGRSAFLRFSGVEKVGGASWSLPAIAACPILDESCVDCYALAGFYHSNLAAQVGRVMRLEYLQTLIRLGDLGPWVDWIVGALGELRPSQQAGEEGQRFFRWHDSGDVFHAAYARSILAVCRATPRISHWLPTRAAVLLARVLAETESFPTNLSITVSCVRGGRQEAEQRAAVKCIKAAHHDAKVTVTYTDLQPKGAAPDWGDLEWVYGNGVAVCPVTVSNSRSRQSCAGCRRCWRASDVPTVYVALPSPMGHEVSWKKCGGS